MLSGQMVNPGPATVVVSLLCAVVQRPDARILLVATLLLSFPANPALHAQDAKQLDKRIGTLESQMRAVQRKVFPGGSPKYFEPEFPAADPNQPGQQPAMSGGVDPKNVAGLQARLLELEKQLGELTGRVELNENKYRLLEEQFRNFKADVEERLGKIETPAVAVVPTPVPTPAVTTTPPPGAPPKPPAVAVVPAASAADTAYKNAYAFFEAKDFDRAESGFKDYLSRFGYKSDSNRGHSLTPNAQYWLGRVYVNKKQFAQAARAFLDGYQRFPKSDKAPDSLLGLGESLTALGKPQDACSAFNELAAVYPDARPEIKTKAQAGRLKAKCS
jgi:tol-pal system protein YbgF